MKRWVGVVIILIAALGSGSRGLGATNEPEYSSNKPLYAKVVLNEEATKILKLVFDESGGTGMGYDTIYADLNLNDDLADDKPIKGTLEKTRYSRDCSFPEINVPVPYNDKGIGVEKPWTIVVSYGQFIMPRRLRRRAGRSEMRFSLEARITLKDQSGEWHYSSSGELGPAEKPEGILAAAFPGKPTLVVQVRPDAEKKGNIGIGAYLTAEWSTISCTRHDEPLKAHIQIQDEQGRSVHAEDVGLDKLSFG